MDFSDILSADPDRGLMLAHAPGRARGALATLWRLDLRAAEIVRSTTEPLIGRMRIQWWHDALTALDGTPAAAEPLLQEVETTLVAAGARGADLARAFAGWDALLDPLPLDGDALAAFAEERGAGFFGAAAGVLGGGATPVEAAGRGWALVDLAAHVSDAATRARALAAAEAPLAEALAARWPRALRPLGMLARFAEEERRGGRGLSARGSPRRMLRALRFRFTGR